MSILFNIFDFNILNVRIEESERRMTETSTTEEPKETPAPVSWVDFLQTQPPGSVVAVTDAIIKDTYENFYPKAPELQMFCPEDTCNAYMFFAKEESFGRVTKDEWKFDYMRYVCRNCRKYTKTFALAFKMNSPTSAEAYKFGELPHFGPPVPPRMLRLIQPDRELFLSGRRCENQGLGIGAFTYYRRVVENQWSRLVSEIIKVAKAINAPQPTLAVLEQSKIEQQFSKAVKDIKDAIPPVLLINGHNPLVLLHSALSQGVHDLPDEECLLLATSIRVVLVELAEKLGQALKDEKELTDAVSKLLQTRGKKTDDSDANKSMQATPNGAPDR